MISLHPFKGWGAYYTIKEGGVYHGVGNLYLINLKKLQIGIGIGKFSIINSEESYIGNFLGTELGR